MAITSGFFRSVGGDRKYTADFFSSYFASFIANGVFPNPSTNLQALYYQQRTVIIKAGKAWINGHYLVNDADFGIFHDSAHPNLNRIDRIVVGLNNDSRNVEIYLKKGEASSNPIAPALTRNNTIYELALADVLIPAGSVNLTQANITDQRLNNELCGLVHGLVEQVDTTTLFNQIQQTIVEFQDFQEVDFLQWSNQRRLDFDSWYASIQDVLDGDVAANLSERINKLSSHLDHISLDITDFGAVEGGIFNSTQALRDAHDALPPQGGKILVPAGIFKITENIIFTKTIILEGSSVAHLSRTDGGSVILCEGESGLIFRGSSSGVQNLMVDGLEGNTGNGITMQNARFWISNCTSVNQGGYGFFCGDTTTPYNINSGYIENIRAKSNALGGLRIDHPNPTLPDANAITINKADLGYNFGDGITLRNCLDNTFIGMHLENNAGYGVQMINSDSNMFLKPYTESNTLGDIRGDAASEYNYVIGLRRDGYTNVNVSFVSANNFVMGRENIKGTFPNINRAVIRDFSISGEGAGFWQFLQNANRDLTLNLMQTGANGNLRIGTLTNRINVEMQGLSVGGGHTFSRAHLAAGTLNFGIIGAKSTVDRTLVAATAKIYDTVVNPASEIPIQPGLIKDAFVQNDGFVTIRLTNITDNPITVTTTGWRCFVVN